jgi:RNA polymerase sigma factor (sigma-70 family)
MEYIIEAAPRGNTRTQARIKFLSSAEETELADRNCGGDISARNELVVSHFPLVNKIAKQYRRSGVEWDDLLSEGRLGLFRAAETFDPHRGARFSTYASWWVKASISEYVERSKSVVRQAYRSTETDKSLNEPVFKDSEETQRIDLIVDEHQVDPWERIATERNATELKELALAPLNERERLVFEARHLADEPQTLNQIGEQIGVSRERARQIDAMAVRKARDAVEPAIQQVERRGRWVNKAGRRDHDVERFLDEYYRYSARRARKNRGR